MSLFIIEANIGSGKSSLLNELQNLKFDRHHILIQEQVSEWSTLKDENNTDILSLFYKDKKKYGYIFQSYVLFSRLSHLIKTIKENPNSIIIAERSHLTDLKIFAKSLYESKDISEIEWIVYNKWHNELKKIFNIKINGIIYLKTDPKVCMDRINKRSRKAENGIPLEYLELLDKKHNEWLIDRPKQRNDVEWFELEDNTVFPVLTLDGNIDFYYVEERIKQKELIVKFINTLSQ